jgi:iron complex transport system substrate-binding protein
MVFILVKGWLQKSLLIALSLVLVLTLVPFGAFETSAASAISVTKDGKKLSFDVQPQIINGRTMVPYQAIAKNMGAEVVWDNTKKQVTVTKGSLKIQLNIGYHAAFKNGQRVILDTPPVIKNGRTLVPLRFISESFGLFIDWNNATKTVVIESTKTINHAMGKTTLKSVPTKVVVLFNGMVDISLTLGVKPTGAVESWVERPWYEYLRQRMTGVKSLGLETQPNLEAIVALKPDLIIGSKMRHEKIYSQLSAIAPTVMTEDVFSWKENLEMASVALNRTGEADAFMADWDAKVAAFKKKMGSRLNTEVSVIRFDPDHARIYYTNSFPGLILEEVGLKRPENQRVQDKVIAKLTSMEQIPQMDADVIFNITSDWRGDGQVFKTQQDWTSHALWKNLNAVKNDKYFDVNEATWNMSGGAMAAKEMLEDLYFYFGIE